MNYLIKIQYVIVFFLLLSIINILFGGLFRNISYSVYIFFSYITLYHWILLYASIATLQILAREKPPPLQTSPTNLPTTTQNNLTVRALISIGKIVVLLIMSPLLLGFIGIAVYALEGNPNPLKLMLSTPYVFFGIIILSIPISIVRLVLFFKYKESDTQRALAYTKLPRRYKKYLVLFWPLAIATILLTHLFSDLLIKLSPFTVLPELIGTNSWFRVL